MTAGLLLSQDGQVWTTQSITASVPANPVGQSPSTAIGTGSVAYFDTSQNLITGSQVAFHYSSSLAQLRISGSSQASLLVGVKEGIGSGTGIGLANTGSIQGRNSGDTAFVTIASISSSNNPVIGDATTTTIYQGGARVMRNYITGTYSSSVGDYYLGTSSSAQFILTLPTAGPGRVLVVQDEGGSAATNAVTMSVPVGLKLNGTTNGTYILNTNYAGKSFISDGTNWFFAS